MGGVHRSADDPIRIAEVPVGAGRVGLSFCPGKHAPRLGGGVWQRDLSEDIARIRSWGADTVVTLIEGHEFDALRVNELPEVVRAAGMGWHHLPIRDGGVPDAHFDWRWRYAGLQLRRSLRRGGSVFVHCRGGLGRAGMVASRLLVEFGSEPREAIAAVRAVRSGAVENSAQENWVARSRPRCVLVDEREDRELACLLGGALGDAMGYRVEFSSRARILREHGPQGIRLEDCCGRLVASDDTQMALFTLEGMERALAASGAAAPEDGALVESIRQAYLDWLQTQDARARAPVGMIARHPEMNAARAPGMTCLDALRRGGRGSPERPINDSKGCGGVMRTAPIGFLDARFSDARVFDLGLRAGALTHGHPDGWLPSGAMALLVRLLATGADWQAAACEAIGRVAGASPQGSDTEALLRKAVQLAAAQPGSIDAVVQLGQGWVGEEALAIGLYAAMSTDRFGDCLALAANHDGDSDSTASIAGQLFGVCHGLLALPVEPVYRIDVLEPLLDTAARWQALREDGAQGATGRARIETDKTPTHSRGDL